MKSIHTLRRRGRAAWQRGQSMVEYLVVGAVTTALVFMPYDGNAGSDTVLVFMLKAIRAAFAKFMGAISLPI
ncbi:MAG: hypothetical protein EOP35_00515 [Rubrivivax sp.]|nr:MAG: hypothetical protein EOP35_00515 [Rubrivivax sp.]